MTILGAREERELLENCYKGGKKMSARDYNKGRKFRLKSKISCTISIPNTWLGLLYKQLSLEDQKTKAEDDHEETRTQIISFK